jgi:hypothetical protein
MIVQVQKESICTGISTEGQKKQLRKQLRARENSENPGVRPKSLSAQPKFKGVLNMKNTSAYAELTKDEAIRKILEDAGLLDEYTNGKIRKAMDEAFREGFLRGEEFAYEYYK